jgi:hypothetical protein
MMVRLLQIVRLLQRDQPTVAVLKSSLLLV